MKKLAVFLFVLPILVLSGTNMQARVGGTSTTPFFGHDDWGCVTCWCQSYLIGIPICISCVNASGACDTVDTTSGCHPAGQGCYCVVVTS